MSIKKYSDDLNNHTIIELLFIRIHFISYKN